MPCQPQSAVGLWGSRQECSKTGSCGPCVCGDTFDQWSEEAAGCRPGGCVRVKGRDKESPPTLAVPHCNSGGCEMGPETKKGHGTQHLLASGRPGLCDW